LSAPKWQSVSNDVAAMFDDFRARNWPETITKAHTTVQRFLQVLVGEEGSNRKGELSPLFKATKDRGFVTTNQFTEKFIDALQGYFASERAAKSTAKPARAEATSRDALLMMNLTLVFIQHCLTETG
jgi:hypothetical protein